MQVEKKMREMYFLPHYDWLVFKKFKFKWIRKRYREERREKEGVSSIK